METDRPWYFISNIDGIDSPALCIYPDRVKHNVELAISMAGDPGRLRPHVKTHKSADITLLMMEAGISKFKCATIAEAEMLANCGAKDVLLAYQPVGPKIARLVELVQRFPQTAFSCLVDNNDSIAAIAGTAITTGVTINVSIDVNVGMNRTGIAPGKVPGLFTSIREFTSLNLIGLHAYDGHVTESDPGLRSQQADETFERVQQLAGMLQEKGLATPVIVMGGSPSFPVHAKRTTVQASPGTFVYWDKGYHDLYPDIKFLPAALVITRIVSMISPSIACVDLGHKAIASENPLDRRVWFLNEPGATFISHSEEHLIVALPPAHHHKVGDVLYGVPFHICPTCALYDSAVVIQNHLATTEWKITARGRKINA